MSAAAAKTWYDESCRRFYGGKNRV
ncbi:hypothetical protein CCACVL1_04428 [Corchorus capsularis]|uniref:Uncharacterized protein n=1 Tax=Corchorus capsularis TaxID=210143 RepID=A0A1R3JSY9_COCAP|nr:hypothetical protein CCACVL1_04428 [Corchorus capsularis]